MVVIGVVCTETVGSIIEISDRAGREWVVAVLWRSFGFWIKLYFLTTVYLYVFYVFYAEKRNKMIITQHGHDRVK